jgi:hypothetical protein
MDAFQGPLLKIIRADRHLEELEAVLEEFLRRMPYYRSARLSEHPGHVTGDLFISEPPPIEIAMIVGDTIHNLRTSLDVLANDLIHIAGHKDKDAAFPFCDTEKDLDLIIKRRGFIRAGTESVELLKSLRPFNGGNALLRGLHDLDIINKHRMIVPTARCISMSILTLELRYEDFKNVKPSGGPYTWPFHREPPDSPMRLLGERIPLIFKLQFPILGPFQGQEIIPTLHAVRDHVLSIVEAFAALHGRTVDEALAGLDWPSAARADERAPSLE